MIIAADKVLVHALGEFLFPFAVLSLAAPVRDERGRELLCQLVYACYRSIFHFDKEELMRLIHWRWTTLFLTLLLGLLSTVCVAQVLIPARDPGRSILMTGFAVSHPGQLTDINDIALGFPRELARRLERDQQFYVRMTPELLSYDWVLTPPTTKMLAQVAATYDSRYVISGDIIGAGIHTVPSMFGLWEKKYG